MLMVNVGFRFPITLGGYGGGYRADDRALVALLGKDDHAHLAGLGVCGGIQAERNRTGGQFLHASDALQVAYDAYVLEPVAAVFAAFNVGSVGGVHQGGVEVCMWLDRCRGRRRDGCGDFAAVYNWLGERQRNLGGLRRVLDGSLRVSCIVADELFGAIDDHLRSVDIGEMQARAVFALPVGVVVRRKAIVPALAIPVVNVLAQYDDLGTVNGLVVVELCQ